MQLYLIRHGAAVDRSLIATDEARPLTDEGAEQMRRCARALKRIGARFDAVLTSPLCRAVQTAEIVCEVLNCQDRLKQCPELSPGCGPEAVAKLLRPYERSEAVALVGHNPDFEALAGAIIGGRSEAAVILKKGGICRIDLSDVFPRPLGAMMWHLTPKLLQMIGEKG
jgi:phosphohistidine phosphatase